MDSIAFLLIFQLILIALNAVFASAEIAVLSVNEAKLDRMAKEGNGRARRLQKLTREPAKFLATIQVAITLSGFLGSAFAADNFSEPLVKWLLSLGVRLPEDTLDAIAVVVITLILSYFTLIFGELVPKRLAMKKSEQIAMTISGPVSAIAFLFRPVVWFLSVSTNLVLRLCGVDPNEAEDEVSEEDIRLMVDAGSEKGSIEQEEKILIQNVFAFNDTTAGDIVTHRTDVVALWAEEDISVWEETIHESRHTLYPVCDGSTDNVIGILNAKDFFRLSERTKETVMAEAVSPAYFVPETVKADVLFRNMKSVRRSMAVVLDECGGMVGIVTLFDLIEELVGDIDDAPADTDGEEISIRMTDEGTYEISGNPALSTLAEATGYPFASGDYDTLTGLLFDRLDVIPEDGDHAISLTLDGVIATVHKIEGHRVTGATLTIPMNQNANEGTPPTPRLE